MRLRVLCACPHRQTDKHRAHTQAHTRHTHTYTRHTHTHHTHIYQAHTAQFVVERDSSLEFCICHVIYTDHAPLLLTVPATHTPHPTLYLSTLSPLLQLPPSGIYTPLNSPLPAFFIILTTLSSLSLFSSLCPLSILSLSSPPPLYLLYTLFPSPAPFLHCISVVFGLHSLS